MTTDEHDLYPGATYASRQPFDDLRTTSFADLDTTITKPMVVMTALMQTYKTSAQVQMMIFELIRGNMVIMFMGRDESNTYGGWLNKMKKIVNTVERSANNPFLIRFMESAQVEEAIAQHRFGQAVVVTAMANTYQIGKIAAAMDQNGYHGKTAVIMDEPHSFFAPPSTKLIRSQKCSAMVDIFKKCME